GRQKCVVVFAKRYSPAAEFDLDEMVSVQVIGGLKRQVRTHAHRQGADDGIADVEVIVQVAGRASPDDPVVGVLGRVLGHLGAEGAAHFHTREDEVDPVLTRLPRCLADFRGFRDRSSLSSTRVVDKRKIVTNSSRYYTCNVWTMYDLSCPVYIRKT